MENESQKYIDELRTQNGEQFNHLVLTVRVWTALWIITFALYTFSDYALAAHIFTILSIFMSGGLVNSWIGYYNTSQTLKDFDITVAVTRTLVAMAMQQISQGDPEDPG